MEDTRKKMVDMSEQDFYEVLGVSPKESAPEPVQTPVATAQEPAETTREEAGAPESVASAPEGSESATEFTEDQASAEETGAESGGEGEKEPTAGRGGKKQEMPPEQRREFAARRRREEQQAAISKAVSDAIAVERERQKTELDALLRDSGLTDSVTGKPVTNLEELKAWKQGYDAAKLKQDLKDGNLTPETIEKIISESPSMQQMKQLLERDQQARRESEEAAAKAKIDGEIQEIHRLDPSINSLKDLTEMPAAKEFYEYVRRGNTFLDAFYLVNRKSLTQAAAEAAKQQTMNAARSKDHLQTSGTSRGAGAVSVPKEEMELFKLLNPNTTEAEIQAYYNKSKGG